MIRMASSYFSLMVLLLYLVRVPFAAGCGGTYTSLTGTIESPNFPNNYTNNLNCSYVITAPAGYRITINFTHFDLEISSPCQFDYVTIRDGAKETDSLLEKLCNYTSGHYIWRSFGNHMRITFVTDATINGSGFIATFTAARQDDTFLLIAISRVDRPGSIYRVDTDTNTNHKIQMSSTPYNPIAIDYDPVKETIYWTEVNRDFHAIRSAGLDGTGVQTVYDGGQNASLEGLAVDPLSRLIFYTDAVNDVIAMLTMSTGAKKTVVSSNLDRPRAIVLDTVNGVMFWTDWGTVEKIERANYDGSERRTLVSLGLSITNALALDVANNRIYWADAGTSKVEFSDLYGNGRTVLLQGRSTLFFFGLALFENALYITDWGPDGAQTTHSEFYRLPLDLDNENVTIKGTSEGRINDVHAYYEDSLKTGPNGCGDNNGGCSIICIPLPSNSSKCMCPDGQLLSSDQKSCVTNIAVFVTASQTLPFQTDGSQELTLICRTDTNVQVTQYRWSVTCARQTGNTCVYIPKPEDDRNVVACTVTLADGRSGVGRLEIMLEYNSITTTTTSTTPPGTTNIAVFVTASQTLPFQTDGSQELTLICRPDTNVQVTQYRWSVTCARQTGNTCVYIPKPEDDRNIVACTVTLADGRSGVGRLEIMLEYPPQTPPVINGYKKGDVLQAGDDLRMTCSVQGGKPLVKNVIFSCDGHPDTAPDIAGQTEVHSVLEFKLLTVEDNGKRCICTAEWKDTDWYRLSVTTTLIVNEIVQQEEQKGPSVPVIAGGAAAGVVVIIIIVVVVVVFVVKRRNQHPTYDRPGQRGKGNQAPLSPYTGLGQVGDAPFAISNVSYDAQTADGFGVWSADDNVNPESLYAKVEEAPDELAPPTPCRPLPTVAATAPTDSYLHPANSPDHGYARHVASEI